MLPTFHNFLLNYVVLMFTNEQSTKHRILIILGSRDFESMIQTDCIQVLGTPTKLFTIGGNISVQPDQLILIIPGITQR